MFDIIDYLDKITIIFAFIMMFFTLYFSGKNFLQRKRDMKNIKFYILRNGVKEELPVTILRKHFTRAEVFGVLGALDKNSKFKIAHTSKIELFNNILDIQNAKSDELIIELKKGDEFDWKIDERGE